MLQKRRNGKFSHDESMRKNLRFWPWFILFSHLLSSFVACIFHIFKYDTRFMRMSLLESVLITPKSYFFGLSPERSQRDPVDEDLNVNNLMKKQKANEGRGNARVNKRLIFIFDGLASSQYEWDFSKNNITFNKH
jgi:hypothetical protein